MPALGASAETPLRRLMLTEPAARQRTRVVLMSSAAVKKYDAKPYRVEFACSMASLSVEKGATVNIGPKGFSRSTADSGATFVRMVGGQKKPSRSSREPPVSIRAPRSTASQISFV